MIIDVKRSPATYCLITVRITELFISIDCWLLIPDSQESKKCHHLVFIIIYYYITRRYSDCIVFFSPLPEKSPKCHHWQFRSENVNTDDQKGYHHFLLLLSSLPKGTPANIKLTKVLSACCLFNQHINLLFYIQYFVKISIVTWWELCVSRITGRMVSGAWIFNVNLWTSDFKFINWCDWDLGLVDKREAGGGSRAEDLPLVQS